MIRRLPEQMTNDRLGDPSVTRGLFRTFVICHLSFVILKEPQRVQW